MQMLDQACPTRGPGSRCGPPAYVYVALKDIKLNYFLHVDVN